MAAAAYNRQRQRDRPDRGSRIDAQGHSREPMHILMSTLPNRTDLKEN